MVVLNCPNCNANIELDDTREFGFCSYCGTKIQIIPQIKIAGIRTNSQKLDSVKKMIHIAEYDQAKILLNRIIEDEPDFGEAWVQLAIIEETEYRQRVKMLPTANKGVQKIEVINNFRNSSTMTKIKKLLGNEGLSICDDLCKRLELNIDEDIKKEKMESDLLIKKISNNILLLSGWTAWDNVSESGDDFFDLEGKIYMFDGKYRAYYIVTNIVNNQINLELDMYGLGYRRHFDVKVETQQGPVAPKSKVISIISASPSELVTSLGNMHRQSEAHTASERAQYKQISDSRINKRICPICGGGLSTFRKCRSNMH